MATQTHPIVATLAVESDRRILVELLFSTVLAVIVCVTAAQWKIEIDEILFAPPDNTSLQGTIEIKMPGKTKKDPVKVTREMRQTKRTGNAGAGAKTTIKGRPNVPPAKALIAMIESRVRGANLSAYQTMSAQMHQDLNKVLTSGARLLTHGKTQIGDFRRGKADGAFNGIDGGDGTDFGDVLGSLMGTPAGPTGTKAYKSLMSIPKETDITMPDGTGGRSVAEVMRVVCQHTQGLRHVYNKFLKVHPGFAGKVTLRFTILPGGSIASCTIVSSSTGQAEFDQAISDQVQGWSFSVIKSGNTTVAIPFSFSE